MERAGDDLPKLLSDHPEKKDAFGAHSAIASSLAELILQNDEGRCVALQGAWGSGKSTVLNMLRGSLEDKAEVFEFDTWSNQGDPLRFSFLRAFASWCRKFPALELEAERWKKEDEDAARQATREVPEESHPRSIPSQWLAALLVVALPVGLALSSDQWSKLFGETAASWIYVAGLLLVLSPFIFIFILWWFYGLNFFSEIVQAIEKTAEGTKQIIVRKGPLATSLYFSRRMEKYCNALHRKNKETKLLIIFDNIDRVAEQNSAKVWSLLTALLEVVHDKNAAYRSNVWVLVPVDLDTVPVPVSIKPASTITEVDPSQREISEVGPDGLKSEFIEKTFQLNIVVPAPLSVATERYFERQYGTAFGNTRAAPDWYECYSALRAARTTSKPLTPRSIKRFINDLVGLWRSRCAIDPDNVPSIAIMALYLCSRDRIRRPEDVANVFHTQALAIQIQDENPIAALAAVAFGSKLREGLQILVSAQMDTALNVGGAGSFNAIADIDGFGPVFAKVMQDRRTWLSTDVAMMARIYELIGEFSADIQHAIADRVRTITRALVEVTVITGQIDARVAVGMARAHVFARSGEQRLQSGLQTLVDSAVMSSKTRKDFGLTWGACVEAFVRTLLKAGIQFGCLEAVLPDNDNAATEILQCDIRKLTLGDRVNFKISDSIVRQLEGKMIQSAVGATLSDRDVVISQTLRDISPEFSAVQICNAMQQRFRNAGGFSADSLAAAISILDDTVRIERDEGCRGQVDEWLKNGFLYHHYNVAQGDKQKLISSFLGLCAGLPIADNQVNNWNQSVAGRQNFTNECNGLDGELLASTYEYLSAVQRFRDVIRNAQTLGLLKAAQALLDRMLAKGDFIYTAESYCDELFLVSKQYSDALKSELASYAVEKLRVDEYLTTLPTIESNLGFPGYERIGASIDDGARGKSFYTRVGELLGLQSFEWWKDAVEKKDPVTLKLAIKITEVVGPGWLISSEARRAIGDLVVAKSFVDDQVSGSYLISLLNALSADERRMVLMQVKNKAVAQRGESAEFIRFCKLAGLMFADAEIAGDINTIVINVLVPAVETDSNNRQLIAEMVEKYDLSARVSGEAKKRLAAVLDSGEPVSG